MDDESLHDRSIVKRSECSMSNLVEWYSQQPSGTRVAILVKDFEMCQQSVLHKFILLLRFVFLTKFVFFMIISFVLIL